MTVGVLRAVVPAAVLMAALLAFGEALVGAALPAMRWVFRVVAGEFRLIELAPDREHADRVLRAVVALERPVVLGGRVAMPDARGLANASTVMLQGLHGAFVALWIALAWPAAGRCREILRRLALAVPAAVLLALVDAPVILAASLWELVVAHLAPGTTTPLLVARDLLAGGGRLALGVLAGCAAVALAGGPRGGRGAGP